MNKINITKCLVVVWLFCTAAQAQEQAAPQSEKKPKVTLRYDDSGVLMIEGMPNDVSKFDFIYKQLMEEWLKKSSGRPTIKVYKLKHVDVTFAATLLDEMFNENSKSRAQSAARNRQRQQQQKNKGKEEQEEDSASKSGGGDLFGLTGLLGGDSSSLLAAMSTPAGIRVVPDKQRNTLTIRARDEDFPVIVELLYKIDQPGTQERDFEIVQLEKISAEEATVMLAELLGIGQQTNPRNRAAQQRQNRRNRQSGGDQAARIAEELQQQELQIGGGEGFSTRDVRVSSMPANNSVIIYGPEEARESLVAMVKKLDEQGSEVRIENYALENASATGLAKALQQAYGGAASAAPAAGGRSRSKSVVITADDTTNTIYVAAPPMLRTEIEARIIAAESQASSFNPREIQILQGDAESIAKSLKEMFASRSRGKTRIAITADPISNQLFVSAPDLLFEQISIIAAKMDRPAQDQVQLRTYKLQYAYAPEVKDKMIEMVKMAGTSVKLQGGRSPDIGPFAVMDDAATNALVVMGSAKTFAIVEMALKDIDQEPEDPTRRSTKTIELVKADAAEVAKNINQLYGKKSKRQGVDPPKAEANKATNVVIVEGTLRQIEQIENELIKPLEEIAQPAEGGDLKHYTVNLQYVDADQAAEILNGIFAKEFEAIKKSGRKGIKDSEMTVTVTPDMLSNQLFINATEKNKLRIDEYLATIDTEAAGAAHVRNTEVFSLKFADPNNVVNAINNAFKKRGKVPEKEQVVAAAEHGTQSVVVTASPRNMDRIRDEIIAPLDNPSSGRERVREWYKLEEAQASAVAQLLRTHINETKRRQRSGQMPVSVTANDNTNSLLLSGRQDEVDEIKGLIAEMDVPADEEAGRYLVVYRVRYANLWSVWNTLTQSYNTRRNAKDTDKVTVSYDWETGSLIAMASKEKHEEIQALLEDIDRESENVRAYRTIKLDEADATEVARVLDQLIRQQRTQRGQTKPSVTANAGTNSLIIYASDKEMLDFQPMIDSMDAEGSSASSPRRIALKYQDASQMADILTRVFTDPVKQQRGRRGNQQQVPLILADDATQTLIVRAQEKDFNEISEMVTELDNEEASLVPTGVRIIQVAQGIDVYELARTIEETIRKGEDFKKRTNRNYKPSYVAVGADTRTNSLIVAGSSGQFEEVEKLVRTLEGMKPTGPTSIRMINLKNIDSDEVKRVLDQLVEQRNQQNRGRRGRRR